MKLSTAIFALALLTSTAPAWAAGNTLIDKSVVALKEVQQLEKKTLGTPDKTSGPLVNLYACISGNVASQIMGRKLVASINENTKNIINNLSVGKSLVEEIKKDDPHFFEISLEYTPYEQDCQRELKIVRTDARIPHNVAQETVRLGELGGALLGAYFLSDF